MGNVGQVKFIIYFGTMFDDINVPYFNDLIRTTATKKIELSGQYVWQNTWLSDIVVNVEDYQDIVGAQYVEVHDEGTESQGAHWYMVRAYQQKSRKTAELLIEYDPLLSIQLINIDGISGVCNRWSVNEAYDAHFRWIKTSEPINQSDKYNYTYFRHSCVDESKALTPVVGFPYDMATPPQIKLYKNQDGSVTNIYYVSMESPITITTFHSTANESIDVDDGMSYYLWRPSSRDKVYQSYNEAVGLGFDLTSNAYMLIASPLITIHLGDSGLIESLTGNVLQQETGLALYDTQYENNKTNDLGIYFELYNEVSGQSVTLANYDLTNTTLELSVDPYSNGAFYARFKGYFSDSSGYSGQVMSGPFKTYSVNSTTPFNYTSAKIDVQNQITSIDTQYQSERMIADAELQASLNSLDAQTSNNAIATAVEFTKGAAYFLGGVASLAIPGAGAAIAGVATAAAANHIVNAVQGGVQNTSTFLAENENLMNVYNANLNAARAVKNQQVAALRSSGTLGKIAPPPFKLNNSVNVTGASYTFVVKRSDLSSYDKTRADIFFRMYGYNVDKLPLTASMLWSRTRFTFIMADDVEITHLVITDTMTRLRDPMTVENIKNRFATGLRIWFEAPNYDYTLANPKK